MLPGGPGSFSVEHPNSVSLSGYKGDGMPQHEGSRQLRGCSDPRIHGPLEATLGSLGNSGAGSIQKIFRKVCVCFRRASGVPSSLGISVSLTSCVFHAGEARSKAQVTNHEAKPPQPWSPSNLITSPSSPGLSCSQELITFTIRCPLLEELSCVQMLGRIEAVNKLACSNKPRNFLYP